MSETDEFTFADLGLGDAPDDPNSTPDGTYKAVVHETKMFTHNGKKEGENRFLIITYRIVDPDVPNLKDNSIDEWKSANKGDSPKKKSFLKQRLLSLGLPKEDVDAGRVNLKKLVGTPVLITVKNKDGFTNINKVVQADDSGWRGVAPASSQVSQSVNSGQVGNVPDLDF